MIYIIEIPHQRPASCWSVHTEQQAVEAINAAAMRCGEQVETFAEAVEYNARDLSSQIVLMADAEALAAWRDEATWRRHGGAAARDALRTRLIDAGALIAPGLTRAAADVALAMWREQIAVGIGDPGEEVDASRLDDWLYNRVYDWSDVLERAAAGDVAAIAEARTEAGLPVLS